MIFVTAVPRATSYFLLLTSPFPRSLLLRLRVRCGGGACDGRSPRYSKTGAERYDNSCRPTGDCDHARALSESRTLPQDSIFRNSQDIPVSDSHSRLGGDTASITTPGTSVPSPCLLLRLIVCTNFCPFSPVAELCNMRPEIRMGRYSP